MTDLIVHRKNKDTAFESDTNDLSPLRASSGVKNQHPWDMAHLAVETAEFSSALESDEEVTFIEPDVVQRFDYVERQPQSALESSEAAEACAPRGFDADWPHEDFGWHLTDGFTQLKTARESVGDPGNGNRILAGILDTGYDPAHSSLPANLRLDLARNFSGSGSENDATDPASSWPLTNPGHGTATIAILAGSQISSNDGSFNDVLGGAPNTEVVPIRIADSVIHFRTNSMAEGIRYAADIGCQVLSISMGGVPTRDWADAVNYAYERGVCIFAAAGNRIGVSPPSTLVYPARFNRVVGVCGFMSDKTPYFKDGFHRKMQGCFGPESVMDNAMSAFTPNIPWAAMGCSGLVNPDGAGTSSATPQCAAAAALWLQKHRPNPAEKWKVVEAVRHALFSTADSSPSATKYYKGRGLLRAADALAVDYDESTISKTPRDSVSFPWLQLLGALEADDGAAKEEMLETEALQVYLRSPMLQQIVDNADPQDDLELPKQKQLLKTMSELKSISNTLRKQLEKIVKGM